MNVQALPPEARSAGALRAALHRHIGRHTDKRFDWDAFPGNRGFPDLARAQLRYIGAGGSPKVDDPTILKPKHFTLSLIHQPVGNYAACHAHEVEESFLVLSGVLTVGWMADGRVVEVQLGPKDMLQNARDIPHGFRNDGVEPVLMSITVDSGKPLPPRYVSHPKSHPPELARRFLAAEGRVEPLSPTSAEPLHVLMRQHLVRYSQRETHGDPAGVGRKVYVGEGGVQSAYTRKEWLAVPRGVAVQPYDRPAEEALFVLDGVLTVGWEEDGVRVEERLGPRDVVLTPAGRRHWFRNDDIGEVQAWMIVGAGGPDLHRFERG